MKASAWKDQLNPKREAKENIMASFTERRPFCLNIKLCYKSG
jgi:hypothetical protein